MNRFALRITSILLLSTILTASPIQAEGEDEVEISVTGVPEDGRIKNPLNASAEISGSGNMNWTFEWSLDGEAIGQGKSIQRYVYPGKHNLTITATADDGMVITRSMTLRPIAPPGWNDEPDRSKNDLIFWSIFGAGGIIFASSAVWIWLKGEEKK